MNSGLQNLIDRVSWVLLALCTALLAALVAMAVTRHWAGGPLHPAAFGDTMPEEDFSNFWAAGHLVRAGRLAAVYSAADFQQAKLAMFGPGLPREDWVYPPTVLLLAVPFSYLPLPLGFALWNAGTLAIAVWLLRWARLPWPILIAGLAGPASWRSLTLGQYGVLMGGLVVAGLLAAPRRPRIAGILLGLATLKPQQGIIVPAAWAGGRNFAAIAAGAAMFVIMAGIVVLAFGRPAWGMFFSGAGPALRGLVEAKPPQTYINDGVSVFWMLRCAGAGLAAAYAGQIAAAAAAMVFCWRAWVRSMPELPRAAFTVCLSLFITPYGFSSDMVAVSIALAIVVAGRGWRLTPLDVAIWLLPEVCSVVTIQTGYLVTPFAVLAVAVQAWRQMNHLSPARSSHG